MNIWYTAVCVSVSIIVGYMLGKTTGRAGSKLGDAFMSEISADKVVGWCDEQFDTRAEKSAVYTFCKHLLEEVKNRLVE